MKYSDEIRNLVEDNAMPFHKRLLIVVNISYWYQHSHEQYHK